MRPGPAGAADPDHESLPLSLITFYDLGWLAGAEAGADFPSTHLSYQANQRSYRSLMKLGRVNPWNCPG